MLQFPRLEASLQCYSQRWRQLNRDVETLGKGDTIPTMKEKYFLVTPIFQNTLKILQKESFQERRAVRPVSSPQILCYLSFCLPQYHQHSCHYTWPHQLNIDSAPLSKDKIPFKNPHCIQLETGNLRKIKHTHTEQENRSTKIKEVKEYNLKSKGKYF